MSLEETLAQALERLSALQATVERQQAEISALRAAVRGQDDGAPSAAAADTFVAPVNAVRRSRTDGAGGTSRRGLLRGAAAGAAVAAAAAVAVGGAEQAHAAPAATAGNFILGASNDADAPTSLSNTGSSTPDPIFNVTATVSSIGGIAVQTNGAGQGALSAQDFGGGIGVFAGAVGTGGIALFALSQQSYAVQASSGAVADIYANGTGRIQQITQASAGAPTSGTYTIGECIRDLNGEMFLCINGGTPGTWVQVAHAVNGYNGGAISYLSKPIRLLDTRGGDSLAQHNGGGPIAVSVPSGTPYTLAVAGVNWQSVQVPAGAVGAIGNVTVVAGAGGGFLAIVPQGAGFSGTATLAYGPNQVVSNSFNTGLNGGALDILVGGSATDVILDLSAVVA